MSLSNLIFPLPFALVWMLLTGQINLAGFLIGYVLSFGMGLLFVPAIGRETIPKLHQLPARFVYVVVYVIRLALDIFLSGVDVSLRVMGFRSIKRSGIIALPLQDDRRSELVAGLSAHSITITPGELVVSYDMDEGVMYVHCLDVVEAEPKLDSEQSARVEIYRRIFGK